MDITGLHKQLTATGLPVAGIYERGDGSIGIQWGQDVPIDAITSAQAIIDAWMSPDAQMARSSSAAANAMADVVQAHLDARAGERGYSSIFAACSYEASAVPAWKAEALACIAWRDAVWLMALSVMDECQRGARAVPTEDEMIGMLPDLVWP
jgi:hypothetical protein